MRTARETSSTYIEYVVDHNRSLPMLLYDETAYYVWGLDLIARIVGSTQQYYHYDWLGSTRALTNNTGTTLATYNYDAFGTIKSQTGSQTNNFLFTGEWRDPETGFYFLRARYYDPVVGRFINRDPFSGYEAAPQSLNRYVYVVNNPTSQVDPSGLSSAPTFPAGKQRFAARLGVVDFFIRLCRGLLEACGGGGGPPNKAPISQMGGGGPVGGASGSQVGSGASFVTTPNGRTIQIPQGWQSRPADNGKGIIYQRPGATGNADSIRIMEPTPDYPNGHMMYYNSSGQPLDASGSNDNPAGRGAYHIPLDYEGALPALPK